jgi:hypothetical protein
MRIPGCGKTRKAAGWRLRLLDPHKRVFGERVLLQRHDQAKALEAESRQLYGELLRPASPAKVGAWQASS